MAAGYAQSRPQVHAWVCERLREKTGVVDRALDIGCGAGISTAALARNARMRAGVEPNHAMLLHSATVAPGAHFVTGQAERLPFADASFEVVAAAGSLNYCELGPALAEIGRVLRTAGMLAVYDFSQGREFEDGPELLHWHGEFKRRYPSPEGKPFEAGGEPFAISLPYSAVRYSDYALTETNVAAAVGAGEPLEAIQTWCRETLADVFGGRVRKVIFRGYLAVKDRPAISEWERRA